MPTILLVHLLLLVLAFSFVSAFSWTRATTAAEIAACQALRRQIFVQEQGVPTEVDIDGQDEAAIHVMCYDDDDDDHRLVATGRLLLLSMSSDETTKDAKTQPILVGILGRIAVHADYRGQGLGRQVIAWLEDQARQAGAHTCRLTPHAYLHDFYAKLGYGTIPGTTMTVVNEHVTLVHMEKILS